MSTAATGQILPLTHAAQRHDKGYVIARDMTGVKMHGRGHDKGYVIARDMTGVKMHGRGHDKGYVLSLIHI